MADKLISQLTAAAGNLQDTDIAEGQMNGEVFTRKLTGAQMRGVEKGEREAQDNVIEAGAGLNANGTFTAPANSWSLRSADFAAGCTDRGGATGALTENILNGLRLLDAKVNAMGSGNYVILKANLSGDTTLTTIVPAGYMLTYVVFLEKAATNPVLDLGTTVGGNEVFINQSLTASEITTVVIQRVFSLSAATTLYLNDDDAGSNWNGSTVDAYFVLQAVIPNSLNGSVVIGYYSGAYGFSSPPLQAEVVAVLGLANLYTSSSIINVEDTLSSTFLFMSDGTQWYYGTAYTLLL